MADGKEPPVKAGEQTGAGARAGAGAGAGAGEGIRSIKSTSLFRAVNFELYAKPVSIINNNDNLIYPGKPH